MKEYGAMQIEYFEDLELLPEQKLCAAIILRAMSDITYVVEAINRNSFNTNKFCKENRCKKTQGLILEDNRLNCNNTNSFITNEEFSRAMNYVFLNNRTEIYSIESHLSHVFGSSEPALSLVRRLMVEQLSAHRDLMSFYDTRLRISKYLT